MHVLQYCGFTGAESYDAIKAIGKKHPEKILPLKARVVSSLVAKLREDDATCTPGKAAETADRIWKIIEDATSYLFNSSHAVCVALDSLYCAYAKAHWPLEFYTTLLSVYASKGDKDRIAKVKEEMKRGFGITVVPGRFRQDNQGFYIDREKNQISDALSSIKHISKKVAAELYHMRDKRFASFTDLLHELEMSPAIDARVITILIKLGYFGEFGSAGKLLSVHDAFRSGEYRFSKGHIAKTQQTRLAMLREQEAATNDAELPFIEQIRAEIEYCGMPLSIFPDQHNHLAVLEVDDRYSPKLRLYNIAKGTVGVMKVRKDTFRQQPLAPGDVIMLLGWRKKPAYQYSDGKQSIRPGAFDLWIEEYLKKVTVVKRREEEAPCKPSSSSRISVFQTSFV